MATVIRRNRRLIVGLLVAVFLCGGIQSAIARDGANCGYGYEGECGYCAYEFRGCAACGAEGCGMWGSGCKQDCKKCPWDSGEWECVPLIE